MNIPVALDCIFIAGFALYCLAPFEKKRIRARWAKLVFIVCSVLGIAKGVVGLAWDLNWFSLGSDASRLLDSSRSMVSGLLLGFIFSLIFSGQLLGKKRVSDSNQPPRQEIQATAPSPRS